jgi:O-antigen ligase
MLYWFFPAWAALLAVRSGIMRRRSLAAVFGVMSVNAGLLALFGIVQFALRADAIYWQEPIDRHFFASFGYANHAGAFFVLMFTVAMGLVVHGAFSTVSPLPRGRVPVHLLCALLCVVGANLSLSLAGIGMSWALAAVTGAYAFRLMWRALGPAGRVNVVAGGLGFLCIAAFLIVGVVRSSPELALDELSGLHNRREMLKAIGDRLFLFRPALTVWREHPWFGAGGWGFRYLAGLHVAPGRWELLMKEGMGNVHNDALQFLAEFGLAGAGLLLAVLATLLAALFRSRVWRRTFAPVPLAGLATVLLYSLMDLPFRCPAVLIAWLVVLAAMPAFMVSGRET